MNWDAFFKLHSGLPREGPGEREDVEWALSKLDLSTDAVICDAGCGPGADIEPLLAAIPHGRLLAVDTHAPFVDVVRARFSGEPRVTARVQDMATLTGPFDLIWSAGALYFLGGAAALPKLRPMLAPGGSVAFSEPCHFVTNPGPAARSFWEGECATVNTQERILKKVADAGFSVLGNRKLADSAWEDYYTPMEARIADLETDADADLSAVLDEARREHANWREARAETGYLLIVARTK